MKKSLCLAVLCASPSLYAANIVTWNASYGNIHAPITYDGSVSRGVSTEVTATNATLTGITPNATGDFDILVPTAAALTHYMELTISPADGLGFKPGQIRVAIPYRAVGGDQNAGFDVRSSLDNFDQLVTTATVDLSSGRNTSDIGLINFDLVADLSSMPDVTDTISYRLYFYDTDHLVKIRGSITTAPEGIRIVGPSAYTLPIPEPSAAILISLAGIGFGLRRRK